MLPLLALMVAAGCSGARAPDAVPADAAGGAEDRPRNVLFLAVDDLRPELGCYGASYADTPHIDALAADGVAFLRHYAHVPTCGASRYALLTGRGGASSGVRGGNEVFHRGPAALSAQPLPGAQSMPELFRRSGYATSLVGKLSHTPDGRVYAYDGSGDGREEIPHAWETLATPFGPWQRGWGAFFAYPDGVHREDGSGHRALLDFTVESDDALPDGLLAEAAVAELRRLSDDGRPFFLGVGFYKPHLPFVAPRADREAMADAAVPPPSPLERLPSAYWHRSGEFRGYRAPWPQARPLAEKDALEARRAYLACVRYVDRQVGRVLAELDALGLADSTVVVLWGDHGWFLGEGELWGKHAPLEHALRSPLIVRAPGVAQPGLRSEALVSTLDVYPTLLELCRPPAPPTAHRLDGVSLVPLLDGSRDAVRDIVVGWWRDAVTVRGPRFRLVQRRDGDSWTDRELYEPEGAAPLRDLLPAHPEAAAALAAALEASDAAAGPR